MNHPLKIDYNPVSQTYTVDHPQRRKLNVLRFTYIRAPGLTHKDVRNTRPCGRECFLDRDKDIVYLGDDEFKISQATMKMGDVEIQRYFAGLIKKCGLASWLQSVS